MKKRNFVPIMLVCLLALSFSFAGCAGAPSSSGSSGASGPSGGSSSSSAVYEDLTITVTGIPEMYNNKYGSIALFKAGSTSDIVAISQNIRISSGKVTMDLIDYAELDKGNLKVFSTPGRYNLFFDLYETDKSNSKINDTGGMSLERAVSGGDNIFDFGIFR